MPEPLPEEVYRFRIRKRYVSSRTHVIEIRSDQDFQIFDLAVRNALNRDAWDHCSALYAVGSRKPKRIAEMYPDNSGPHQRDAIGRYRSLLDRPWLYVYDFAEWIEYDVILEDIKDVEPGAKYPRWGTPREVLQKLLRFTKTRYSQVN